MRKLKSFIVLAMILFLLTGCVKFNANMEIRKDKSMTYSIIYAFDSSMFKDQEIIDEDAKKDLQEQGFTLEPYEKDNYKGFTISKNFANIDDVSSLDETKYNVSGLLDKDENVKEIFTVKKGFLKNVYTAKFSFNSNDSSLSGGSSITDGDIVTDTDDDFDLDTDDSSIGDVSSNLSDSLSSLTSSMDLSFNVKLPYSAKSNNATTVNNDSKDLSWSLSSGKTDAIEFSFELYNMVNIYIACGIAAIIIIIALAMIFKRRK